MALQQTTEPPGDLITPRQASRIAKCHVSTIFRWIQTGELPAWRRGTARYLVSEADVRGRVRKYVPPRLPGR